MMLKFILNSLLFLSLCPVSKVTLGAPDKHRCSSLDAHWNSTPGECVNFLVCPRLLEFAKRPGKSTEDFGVLRTLTCGFRNEKPKMYFGKKICCPYEDIRRPPKAEKGRSNLTLEFPEDAETDYDDEKEVSPFHEISMDKAKNEQWNPLDTRLYKRIQETPKNDLVPRLEDCGEPRQDFLTSSRIIGGAKAQPGEFPYMALLFRIDTETDEEEQFCAGTILNQFYILTAAHCITTNEKSNELLAFIQVGVTDVTQRCQHSQQLECRHDKRYEVDKTIVHEDYVYGSRDRSHDIALIRTKKPIDFDEQYIRPVCLPYTKYYGISDDITARSSTTDPPSLGVVAGWGRENNSGPQSSPHLKFTILPILTRNECQSRYGTQVKISKKQICAGGEIGKDTCIGDSGGPILIPYESLRDDGRFSGKMFQTGIISFGPALCGKTGKPSVYTHVASYIDWILENMHS